MLNILAPNIDAEMIFFDVKLHRVVPDADYKRLKVEFIDQENKIQSYSAKGNFFSEEEELKKCVRKVLGMGDELITVDDIIDVFRVPVSKKKSKKQESEADEDDK